MVISWFFLVIEGLICYFFKSYISENNIVFCSLIITVNILVVFCDLMLYSKVKKENKIIILGFVYRIILLVWDLFFRHIYALPGSGADSEMYAYAAKNGYMYGYYGRGEMYSKYIAIWYRLFGVQRPIAQYTNVLLAITTIVVVLKTMYYLKIDEKSRKNVMLLMCFLPNFAILNSILLRETIITMLLGVSVYYYIKWLFKNNVFFLVGSVVTCCLAATFHSGAIAVLLGEAVVYILYDKNTKDIRLNSRSILSIGAVTLVFLVMLTQFGNVLFGKFGRISSATDVMYQSELANTGGSAYDAGFAINNNILNLIINTPIRMFYFLAAPMPWSWRGISDIIAFIFSSLVFLYIYFISIKGLKNGNKNRVMIIILLIFALCSALIFAWGVSNAGTAVRHRDKFVAVYMILYAVARSKNTILKKELKSGEKLE